jgi:hypothetical protein
MKERHVSQMSGVALTEVRALFPCSGEISREFHDARRPHMEINYIASNENRAIVKYVYTVIEWEA